MTHVMFLSIHSGIPLFSTDENSKKLHFVHDQFVKLVIASCSAVGHTHRRYGGEQRWLCVVSSCRTDPPLPHAGAPDLPAALGGREAAGKRHGAGPLSAVQHRVHHPLPTDG